MPTARKSPVLKIPDVLSAETVGDCYTSWLAATGKARKNVKLDGSEVETATTPGLQLLIALELELQAKGYGLGIADPSLALMQAAVTLGLNDRFDRWMAAGV